MRSRTAVPVLIGAAALAIASAGGALAAHETFSDTAGNPHEAGIHFLSESGITSGCGDGRYCPQDALTRGQMATFLHRLAGRDPDAPRTVDADAVDGLQGSQLRTRTQSRDSFVNCVGDEPVTSVLYFGPTTVSITCQQKFVETEDGARFTYLLRLTADTDRLEGLSYFDSTSLGRGAEFGGQPTTLESYEDLTMADGRVVGTWNGASTVEDATLRYLIIADDGRGLRVRSDLTLEPSQTGRR